MAKILKDSELAEMVTKAVEKNSDLIDDAKSYGQFLEDLTELLCRYFGGEPGTASFYPGDGLGWTVGVHVNESALEDLWNGYDTDVIWVDGKECEAKR